MVREKSGNFVFFLKVLGISFLNPDFHENLLLLSIIDNVCHGFHQYESAHVNFQLCFYCVQVLHQQHLTYNAIQWSGKFLWKSWKNM